MKTTFEQEAFNRIVLVLKPENHEERLLMAAWLRYDCNQARFSVQRCEDGKITTVTVLPSTAE